MVRAHRLPDIEAQDERVVREQREYDDRLREEERTHHWQRADQKHRMSDLSEQDLQQKRAFAGKVRQSEGQTTVP